MGRDGELSARCCIAGGGPAGVMLGFLLARAGVDVLVLEKHADFFRDFRGDTIHPSTLDVLDELGLADAFLALRHQEVRELAGVIGGVKIPIADFSHVPARHRFIALIPQWDFLDFLAREARRFAGFRLVMEAEAVDLERDGERIRGLRARTPDGEITVRADLVVAADGRHSRLRECARLPVRELGAPMDVLWMRIDRAPDDPRQVFGYADDGAFLILIDRDAYYQAGMVIRKGAFDEVRAAGIEALRARITGIAPFLAPRVASIRSWDDVSLLTVAVDRLERWWLPGLLCIGDAAHAMSPIGGVGINLAIQDAVAAANLLAAPLRDGALSDRDLAAVQRRRALPARMTQAVQVAIQNLGVRRVLASRGHIRPPAVLRLVSRIAPLRRIPGYLVGIGFRPEHVIASRPATTRSRPAPRS